MIASRKIMFWLGFFLVTLGIVNFASLLVIRALAGGSAFWEENGHYYLYDRNWPAHPSRPGVVTINGRPVTEVSQNTYRWLHWQETSQLYTVLAAGLGAYLVVRAKRS